MKFESFNWFTFQRVELELENLNSIRAKKNFFFSIKTFKHIFEEHDFEQVLNGVVYHLINVMN
jgi:hypothetical protein